MSGSEPLQPMIVVAGPTGTGKSELALRLAGEFGGEIVNCDSLQIYRYLEIGTAKLPPAKQRGIPHHLLDFVDPDQVFTAGEYARLARSLLSEISARGRLPVVVGGTGFYLRALLEGLFPGPGRDDRLRARLVRHEKANPGWLHRMLERFDPPSALRIHASDVQKATRAVEVLLLTRRPLTSWFGERTDALEGFRVLKLGLNPPRLDLYKRLDDRTRAMFEGGLLEEVRHVLALGFPATSKALESHGYRQAIQYLGEELCLTEAIESAQRNTRRYAKRQWTWFLRDKEIQWLPGLGDAPAVQSTALELARSFLQA